MVTDLVRARRRDEGDQFLQQFLRLEDHMRGAVAPASLQAVEQAPISQPRESLRGPPYGRFLLD